MALISLVIITNRNVDQCRCCALCLHEYTNVIGIHIAKEMLLDGMTVEQIESLSEL
jgi:hypothetical protein